MAGSALSQLVVLLGLDATEFTRGLTKAEYQAKQFAQNTRTAILEVGKVLGALEIGRQLIESTKGIIAQAEALNDLSDATGSSVESLSRLTNQAKVAGTDFATVQNALLKLSQGMAGADDEATKAKEALRILGITTKDPVVALEQAAVKLNTYADGVNKVGFAIALFGKQGGQFTATLKDIAESQDVNSTITAQQAAQAEALGKEFRRLSVEAEGFKNLVLSGLVPVLRDLIAQFRIGIEVAGGFVAALRTLGQIDTGDLAGETKRITAALEDAQAKAKYNKEVFGADLFGGDKAVQNFKTQLSFIQRLARERGILSISDANNDARDQRIALLNAKPPAPNPPKTGTDNSAKLALDKQLKELEAAIRLEEDTLRDREQFLNAYYRDDVIGIREFFAGRNAALSDAFTKEEGFYAQEEAAIRAFLKVAPTKDQRLEQEAKLAEVLSKRARLQQSVATQSVQNYLDEDRAIKQLTDSVEKASIALLEMQDRTVEAARKRFDLENRSFKGQLTELGKSSNPADQALAQQGLADLETTRTLILQRAELTKATRDYQLSLDELGIAQQRIDNAQQAGTLTTLEALRAKSDLTATYVESLKKELAAVEAIAAASGRREDIVHVQQLKAQLESLAATGDLVAKQFNDIFAGALTDALTDFVTGTKSAKQAFLDFAKSIEQSIARIAARNLAEAIFGGKGPGSGAGDFFSAIFSKAGGLFGSLLSGGGGGVPGVGFSGGGFGEHFASGTTYAPGGLSLVGEGGPEWLNLPPGTRVQPVNYRMRRGYAGFGNERPISIVQHIANASGASARQVRAAARDGVMAAIRDR